MATNIVEAIEQDHQDLRHLMETLKDEEASTKEKKDAYKAFSSLLKSHTSSEEKALYQPCLKIENLKVLTEEAFVEHGLASLLMKKLLVTRDADKWSAHAKVLAELVEKHIEEEESESLPQVESELEDDEKEEIGEHFLALRKRTQRDASNDNSGALKQAS